MDHRRLLLAATLLAGCTQAPRSDVAYSPPKPVSTDFGRLQQALEGILRPGEAVLYEGLPSEFWEPQLLEQEMSRKRTVRIQGYPFYEERLELSGGDAERLTSLLSVGRSFQRLRESKTCGGYQPDYCIEWGSDDGTTRILISLECKEVKIFAPGTELHCDLSAEAGQKLEQWLGPRRKNRPVAEPG
jgi:hypothetical protein